MKRYSILLLRCAIWVAAIMVLAMIGIAAGTAIMDKNPDSEGFYLLYVFIAGVCATSVPYYIALSQAYKLLNYIETKRAFSEMSERALKVITRCAIAVFVICTVAGLPFFYVLAQLGDSPGLVIVGMLISGVSFVIAVFASVLNRLLREVIEMKTENDLTI